MIDVMGSVWQAIGAVLFIGAIVALVWCVYHARREEISE